MDAVELKEDSHLRFVGESDVLQSFHQRQAVVDDAAVEHPRLLLPGMLGQTLSTVRDKLVGVRRWQHLFSVRLQVGLLGVLLSSSLHVYISTHDVIGGCLVARSRTVLVCRPATTI